MKSGMIIPEELREELKQVTQEGRTLTSEMKINLPSEKQIRIINLANNISSKIGDTFIDFHHIPPLNQWYEIINLLEDNGFEIKEKDNG